MSWWPGDGNTDDLAGTNTATLQGGATVSATGEVGSAFGMDGTNGFVRIPDSLVFHLTNLTLECWVRFSSLESSHLGGSPAGQQFIVFKANTSPTEWEGFSLSKDRFGGSKDAFSFSVAAANGTLATVVSVTNIAVGTWYHVAGVRGTNFIQLFVNGNLQAQTNVSFSQDYTNEPLYFGTTGRSAWDGKLNGSLDEVSLYNRALSSTEIASIYAAGASGKCKEVNITLQPTNQTAGVGGNASFSVAATGFAPLSYRWRLNSAVLPGATNATLLVTNVQFASAGTYTVVVSNVVGSVTSTPASLTVVCPVVTLSPGSLPNGTAGTAYNQTLTGAGGQGPYSFSTLSGALPPGLVLSGTGSLAGTPAIPGSFNFSVRAADTNGCSGTNAYALLIGCPAIIVSPSTLSSGVALTAYSANLSGSGGGAPYNFTVLSGSLPPGLVLSGAGALSGTPAIPGSFNFSVRAADTNGCSGTNAYTLAIGCPAVTVSPAALLGGTALSAYITNFIASGGAAPYSFSVAGGGLPPGLTLSGSGALSGTPANPGSFNFSLRAVDTNGCSGTNSYSLVIGCPAIAVGPASLSSGTALTAYSTNFSASGGAVPYTFSVVGGALPTGLTLSSGGVLSGTPANPGSFNFSVRAADSNGCSGTNGYTLVLGCPAITLNPGALLPGTALTAYSTNFGASGGAAPYSFSVSGGGLPPGLTLSGSGLLSGTPAIPGSFDFSVRAADTNGCSGTNAYTLVIGCPAITVNPPTLVNGTALSSYSANFSGSGGSGPYAYSMVSGSTPPGMVFSGGGSLSGTPTAPGSFSFSIRAIDTNGCSGTNAYTLVIGCPAITVGPAILLSGTALTPYSTNFSGIGGSGPYAYSLASGNTPPGLVFTGSGALSGTPSLPGSFGFSVRATDANGCSGTNAYSLTVACPSITVAPAALSGGTALTFYSTNFSASGGVAPYSFSLAGGSPPPGLVFSGGGSLFGTPNVPGNFSFSVRATDVNGCSGTNTYLVAIACPAIGVGPAALPDGFPALAYSTNLSATGGVAPYTFSVSSGSLPPGLILSGAGLLSGTPTTSGGSSFSVRATDANGCSGTNNYSVLIGCPNILLSPAALSGGTWAVPYSTNLNATNGVAPYTFSILSGGLPPGLALSTGGGLSGTPTVPGSFSFSIAATDVHGCPGSNSYTLAIACAPISVGPAALSGGTAGVVYSTNFNASGGAGPYVYSVSSGALSPGLTLSGSGLLGGTPTNTGTFNFGVTAIDTNGCSGTNGYSVTIGCPAISVAPATLANGIAGSAYGATLSASGAVGACTYSVLSGNLPPGLSLSNGGLLSGTPTTAGSFNFSVRATDANGCFGTNAYTIGVSCPSITLTPSSLASATALAAYSTNLSAGGGTPPYSFGLTAGTLPAGLNLSPAGTLSGTPGARGTNVFTVTATDAYGCAGNNIYTLVVGGGTLNVTVGPTARTNEVGTIATFTANTAATPPLTFRWLLNGASVFDDGRIIGSATSNLTIQCAQASDAGNYSVIVSNLAGIGVSTVAPLVVTQLVVIPDPQLEAAFAGALSKCGCPHITTQDLPALASLTCLWAGNRGITNLAGLQYASNLTGLYLNDNSIASLRPLTNLTRLKALELYNNAPVVDLFPLTSLTNLNCLILGGNSTTNYAPLASLASLTSLSVRGGNMNDLTVLTPLVGLTSLSLWQNSISNVAPLGALTNLANLDLRGNAVANLASLLTGPTRLTSLYLGGNSLTNLPALQSLNQLSLLNLDDNGISDLSPITNLASLSYLSLSRTLVTNFSGLGNLKSLAYLELRGNSITNLAFLSGLTNLQYADLSYNAPTNLASLSGLARLNSLALGGNRLTNSVLAAGLNQVTNLWLFDNFFTSAQFVTNFPRLTHLNLDNNALTNIQTLSTLPKLAGLGLSLNPIPYSGYSVVGGLTNLTALRLEGNCLPDSVVASFLASLARLTFLDLAHNQIGNLAPLAGLTNAQEVYLRQNRLTDISSLTSLPQALDLDVSGNALNLAPGSSASSAVASLQCSRAGAPQCPCGFAATQNTSCQGVNVTYLPQDQPPSLSPVLSTGFSANAPWPIAVGATSTLQITAADNDGLDGLAPCYPVTVTAASSSPGLVSIVATNLAGVNNDYTLTLAASNVVGGTATITLTATDQAGLITTTNFPVVLVPMLAVSNLCPSLDTNLLAAMASAAGKAAETLSTVDLLQLASLTIYNGNLTEFCVWPWLTNLTSLSVNGGSLSSMAFLTNLSHLAYLQLSTNALSDPSSLAALQALPGLAFLSADSSFKGDTSSLAGLTNLTSLNLRHNSLTNLSFVSNLYQLATLDVATNKLTSLAPLSGLTNLAYLFAEQNRLPGISSLATLPKLFQVDLSYNLVANTNAVIQALSNVTILTVSPQRTPPWIDIRTNWVVDAGTNSSLPFNVWDTGPLDQPLAPSVQSFSPGLGASISANTNYSTGAWFLVVSPSNNRLQQVTLVCTNDVGLRTNVIAFVVATNLSPVDGPWLGDTNWASGGAAQWFLENLVTFQGQPAAQSGAVGNSQQSWLQTTVVGPGRLSFWWKVSSEPQRSNETFDFLEFDMPGQSLQISGQVDWTHVVLPVPPGPQTLTWTYSKDPMESWWLDAGWLADVLFEPGIWLELAGRPTNSTSQLLLHGVPGRLYTVLATTNLVATNGANWFGLLPAVTATNLAMPFTDTNASSARRFYRLNGPSSRLETPGRAATGDLRFVANEARASGVELATSGSRPEFPLASTRDDGLMLAPSLSLAAVLPARDFREDRLR